MSAVSIENHPGYLGWTSKGVIAIHADWPAYAVKHGWRYALMTLGQFPGGTSFRVIDDIDQCFLFIVGLPDDVDDKFDERHFHVALWHEDALELSNQGYVSGVSGLTPQQWAEGQIKGLEGLWYEKPDGSFAPVPEPNPNEYEDEEATVALILGDGLTVTKKGISALRELLVEGFGVVNPRRVAHLQHPPLRW